MIILNNFVLHLFLAWFTANVILALILIGAIITVYVTKRKIR